jgi:hypothetical protein
MITENTYEAAEVSLVFVQQLFDVIENGFGEDWQFGSHL